MAMLVVSIGLPASGKSSLAKQLAGQLENARVISTDAIRAQLFGDEIIQGPWVEIERELQRQFESLVALEGRSPGNDSRMVAIYDATNAQRLHRQEAIALGRSCGFTPIIGLWVATPVEVCLERNRRRGRQVPDEVIWKMHEHLQTDPPKREDGFDEVIPYPKAGNSTEIALKLHSKNRT